MQIHLHVTHKMRMMMIYAHLANWILCVRRQNSKSYMCRSVRTFVCLVPNIGIRRWQIWAVGWRKLKPRPTVYTAVVSISIISCIQTIKSHANLFSKWFHIFFLSLSKLPKMEMKPILHQINKLKQCATLFFCVGIAAMVEFIGRSFKALAYFNWIWFCVVLFLPIER